MTKEPKTPCAARHQGPTHLKSQLPLLLNLSSNNQPNPQPNTACLSNPPPAPRPPSHWANQPAGQLEVLSASPQADAPRTLGKPPLTAACAVVWWGTLRWGWGRASSSSSLLLSSSSPAQAQGMFGNARAPVIGAEAD
jgi:hypothetical protein